ncbi:MAG TPA: MdtA/MuxA family multidrug efflux RND transporter periplasmic adaptor subunit [Holophagaceae bacterium]|nr:MdtA/MuxA family multidrug efflux RND transporter periplasmic adaptor subunit [Holophagaceae bacterium]
MQPDSVDSQTAPLEAPAGSRAKWGWALAGAAVLFFGYRAFGAKGGAGETKGGRGIPVTVVAARKADMPVALSGLGSVTPLSTAVVRSRVDGQIVKLPFREGQLVHEGEVLAEIDPRPFQIQLMQAEGQRAKDEASLKNALMDLRRIESLVKQGILPQQQLDAQTAVVNQFEGAVKSDQGTVENAKLNLVYSRVTAPISGRVGLRAVDLGNTVRASDPNGLVTITQTQPISVVFTLPADQVAQVQRVMQGGRKLSVEAFDRDMTSRLAAGGLEALDNQIDAATGTVKLRALFPNTDGALFPNQFVNARLLVDVLKDAVVVPTAALQRSPEGMYVYVVKAEGVVELRNVTVQATSGEDTAVAKGVTPGELVVIDGVDKLKPGAKVVPSQLGGGTQKKGGA